MCRAERGAPSSVPTRGSYLVEGSCVFGRIASDRPCYRHGWRLPELLRKEVIQPHLPVRLPCYDLAPITGLTLGACLLTVGVATSGPTDFRGLTGGVYKAREHIHRRMLTGGY